MKVSDKSVHKCKYLISNICVDKFVEFLKTIDLTHLTESIPVESIDSSKMINDVMI